MAEKEIFKAYEDMDFLKSPSARVIRILAEYLEPAKRFKDEGIDKTIVFFGSARTLPMDVAKQQLADLEAKGASETEIELACRKVKCAKYYEDARQLAYKLTQWSQNLPKEQQGYSICSGGGPGIMEAGSRGAHEAGGENVGFNISLPFEQHPNPYITDALNFEFHYFFMRKFWFLYLAKAIVAFPGGFGTMDEVYEALTLLQTKKLEKKMVVLLYGRDFWKKHMDTDSFLEWQSISPEDLKLIKYADTPEEAFTQIVENIQ